jgi:hypothetical protein
MYSIKTLRIRGYRDEPVPHTFYEQEEAPAQVALLLPGMGYTSHMPLLYYPARIMLSMCLDWNMIITDEKTLWLFQVKSESNGCLRM